MASLCPSNVAPSKKPEGGFLHTSMSNVRDYQASHLKANSLRISQQIEVKQKSGFPDSVALFK
jgi:hypothetical protein